MTSMIVKMMRDEKRQRKENITTVPRMMMTVIVCMNTQYWNIVPMCHAAGRYVNHYAMMVVIVKLK